MKVRVNLAKQAELAMMVNDAYKNYKQLLQPFHQRLLDVYKELNTFNFPKKADWSTTFKVNKLHEVSNKILPRIVSRNPKWIVSVKPDLITTKPQDMENLNMQAHAVQDLLHTIYDKYNLSEVVRLWAKGMVNYWIGYAEVKTKYEISRTKTKVNKQETYIDEAGEEQTIDINEEITEKVADKYVTVEPISWADVFYDPRYVRFCDMPAIIRHMTNIRLWELVKNKKKYMNIDKLEYIAGLDRSKSNIKDEIYNVTGINFSQWTVPEIDKDNLTVDVYYGLCDIKDNYDERLYEIWVVNSMLVIKVEEITQIPIEQIRCFEDTETNLATWFLEPIVWLQKELNFKKNSASEYINHALNRSWIRSPNSWVNPKKLISKPNNIIPTTKSVDEAMRNLMEVPHRTLDASYFQEQNDFERQIQWLTFTVDTNNAASQQWLTNTATGIRIKFFESNVVIDEIRKHFEQWLERLAYKLLQEIADNWEENITIKKMDDDTYWNIHKEAIVDALDKFEIKIESWTSSYDTLENRREDSIAKFNIMMQAAQAGVAVDIEQGFKDILETFEWVLPEKYIKKQEVAWMPTMPWMSLPWEIDMPEWLPDNPADITQQIAGWWLTAGV
jgi:hypothetical protein